MAVKKETIKNTNTKKDDRELERELLLTEEEYARRIRQKNKETMNRILRVVGLFASFLILYVGIFDPLFELSYFGWIFDKEIFKTAWDTLNRSAAGGMGVYDDPMQFGLWLPQLGVTTILILATIGSVYLLVYNVIDIVGLIKRIFASTHEITKDFASTLRDTAENDKEFTNRKKKKPSLFTDNENMFKENSNKRLVTSVQEPEIIEDKPKKKPLFQRRKEVISTDETGGLTEEQLDRLLSGETIDLEPAKDLEPGEKNLFED